MKKMKYIIFALCTFAFTMTSCEDFLNITPDGQSPRDEQLSTETGIEDAMYGVYSQLRSESLYGQELYLRTMEILSQTLYYNVEGTNVTPISKYDWTHSDVQSIFEGVWVSMYNNISNVNSILDAPLVANAKEYPFTIYRGEALGLRAFMHFDLVRLFAEQYTVNPDAKGIPYATEFSLKTPAFESLKENYKHIIDDLLEADSLLAEEDKYENERAFMFDRQIHFNKYAVKAALARVYLTMGDKKNAAKYAQEVIHGEKYELKSKTEVRGDVAGVLSEKECLFGLYHKDFYSTVSVLLQQTVSFYSLNLRPDYEELYSKDVSGDDYRVSAYFSIGNDDRVRLSKFTDTYELNNNASDRPEQKILGINLIRIPEMYYIASEALLESDYDKALELYNTVREHRGLDKLADKDLTVELINDERYKEMIGEGQTYFNFKRQNLPIPSSHDEKIIYKPADKIYQIPVPDIEIENRN